jgi:hypothetical protein
MGLLQLTVPYLIGTPARLVLAAAIVGAIAVAVRRAIRIRPGQDIERETAKRDGRIHFLSKVLAFTTAVLPAISQAMRFEGLETLDSLLFPYAAFSVFLAPLLIAWGIGFTLYLRLKRKRAVREGPPKPSLLVFVVSVPLWLFSGYTYTLLPLFLGDAIRGSQIHRTWMDGWVDWLLRANL